MELTQLRAFIAIAEEGSVRRAVSRLFTAQPALTRRLAKLEQELGVQLFDRSARGVTLTPAGASLLVDARSIVASADALVDAARSEQSTARGRLTIGVPEEGLHNLTPVVMAAYRAAHPNVDISLVECDYQDFLDFENARSSEFDAVLWGLDSLPEQLDGTPVYRERLQVVVSAESELAEADQVSLDEALGMRFIDMGAFMQSFGAFLYLSSFRNGATPYLSREQYLSPDQLFESIARGDGVICATPGTTMMLDESVSFVEIDAEASTALGVVLRNGEQRQHVQNLARIGSDIGNEMFHLVPEAMPPA